MPIEATSDRSINEAPSNETSSSTWNGKDVSCPPLEPTDAVIRAIAFVHLQAQKKVFKLLESLSRSFTHSRL